MNTTFPGHTLILGGGISGLSLAWFLHQRGQPVTVLDAGQRPGGSIRTEHDQGYQIELGPNSTLQKAGDTDDALGRLVKDLNLDERLIEASPVSSKRFVMHHGRLKALPDSPPKFILSTIFSPWAKLRLLAEPLIGWVHHEEHIAEFVTRRLGREFLDYAIDPFISGVYAGDPGSLSVAAAAPKIHQLEQSWGSLIVGGIMVGKKNKAMGMPRGRLVTFDGGLELLPATITARLPAGTVRTGIEVITVRPVEGGWQVEWRNPQGERGLERAERVVLAMPAHAAAKALFTTLPAASQLLAGIAYAPVASTALGYARDQVSHPLDGFGFLLPRRERVRLLGALFSSSLFPGRAPDNKVLLTSFIGGAMDHQALTMPDPVLEAWVRKDLADTLGIRGEPELLRMTRYQQAIPQYNVGHLNRIKALDKILKAYPGIHTRANWRDGISVSDCVLNAEKLAKRMTGELPEEPEEEEGQPA
ncbi:Protoporphyrinogen oxidase [Candidatus Magnetaquicoccaceae bacterium FCR-1]|uniref:Protoporphyrinogen oxidase n=1 Tax=Candidatus Magnetaquiglobus chichijimensis TaxID=3141448 RepID=A0ABQ0CCC9_9PROT